MKRPYAVALAVAVTTGVVGAAEFSGAAASPPSESVTRELTGSNHGAITLTEAEAGARRRFVELDTDHDRKLDPREAAPILSRDAFVRADTDRDGYLNTQEYFAVVQLRFRQADVDRDGTLNAADLASAPGTRLVSLVRY